MSRKHAENVSASARTGERVGARFRVLLALQRRTRALWKIERNERRDRLLLLYGEFASDGATELGQNTEHATQ